MNMQPGMQYMQPGMGMQPGMQYMMGPQGNYIPMGYAPQMAQMQAGQMGGMRPGQRPPNMQPGAGMGYPGGVQYLVGPQQGQQGVPPGVMLAPPGAPLPHGARPVRGESRQRAAGEALAFKPKSVEHARPSQPRDD